MQFGIRWFALGHLDRSNPERPDVGFRVVTGLLDHLGRHPVRSSDKLRFLDTQGSANLYLDFRARTRETHRVLLCHGRRQLSRDAEIGKLD